jgi:hypothetical protein
LLQSKGLRVAAVQLIEDDGLAIRQSIVSKNVSGDGFSTFQQVNKWRCQIENNQRRSGAWGGP